MPLLTLAELRAIVGEAGAHLSDEELLRRDAIFEPLVDALVGHYRDQRDPVGAVQRQERARRQLEQLQAPRHRRYLRARERARAKRTA